MADDLDKRQSDVLVRVPYRKGGEEVLICILVEHQSRPDPAMAFRFLRYMVGVWTLQLRKAVARGRQLRGSLLPFLPIVLYTGRRKWRGPMRVEELMHLPSEFADFVPRFGTLFLDLKKTPPDRLAGSALALALRVMQVEDAPLQEVEQVLASAVEALDNLPSGHRNEVHEALHFLLLLIRHRRAVEEQEHLEAVVTSAARKHRKDVEAMRRKSAVETWLEEGLAQGLERGRQEGRQEAMRVVLGVLTSLQQRFGLLPQHVPVKLGTMSLEDLESLLARIPTAPTLAELNLAD